MLPIAVKNATLENLKELNIDLYNQILLWVKNQRMMRFQHSKQKTRN